MTRTVVLLALALSIPAGPSVAQDPQSGAALAAVRHEFVLTPDGRLGGAGGELLREASSAAQFVLIGEDHGVAEIPRISAALLRHLQGFGFSALAIEIGPPMAAALEASLRDDPSGVAYVDLLRAHWPGTAFYTWNGEAELLREAVALDYALWGLDYDILGDRYALRRLRELAPDAAARDAADRAIATADAALEAALAEQNPGKLMMFGGPEETWDELRQAYADAGGAEATAILDLLAETRAINALFTGGKGQESNWRRALLNKRQFARRLAASSYGGELPKVVLKFGAYHMMRGRTPTAVFDLGSAAAEWAESRGGHSFAVYLSPGAGTQQAQLDPRTMDTVAGEVQIGASAQPFYDAVDGPGWWLFDLRPLRAQQKALAELPEETRQLIFGYDAFVVLGGSTPQVGLELR